MTDLEFRDWQKIHADLFNMHAADDVRLFVLWEFSLKQFGFAELREASFAVASNPSDQRRFRENHLSMLREFVLAKRSEAAPRHRERQEREFANSNCADCHATGLIRVPHPSFIADLELTRPMFIAVACLCAAGVAKFNTINSRLAEAQTDQRLMDVTQYEGLVPDWRVIVAAHAESEEREHQATSLARESDRTRPIDVAAIAGRMARS